MNAVFLQILNMSLTASYVILFVLAARLLLKKAPKIFSYTLWGVVLFRLICPFSFEGLFSLLMVNTNSIPSDIAYAEVPQINTGITIVDNAANPLLAAQTASPAASVNQMQIWITLGNWIWLVGIAALLIYSFVSLLRLRSNLVGAVKWHDNIFLADHVASPFVIGVIHPKIYLPSNLSAREQEYIILHEQTHIRRLDHVIKIIAFLVLTLHWFNPLVWLAFFLCVKDMEMSCDESVLKRMDADIRQEYCASLLSLATGKKRVAGIPLAFGEGDTKSRIKNVLNYKKPAFWIVASAVIVCIILTVCLVANPRTNSKEKINGETYDAYTVEGITVYVPEQYADLVMVDTEANDKYLHQIIALYYKPAYDAHAGLGLMFSIERCSYEQMLEILNEASDGVYLKATDGENYYLYSVPTDAQWNLPEEAEEYEKICDSITVSYGELDEISSTDLKTLSTQADAAAAGYSNISFYMDNAEDAALAFAREEYGTLLTNLPEDNRFAVTDYALLNFSLGEISDNAVSGRFTFAVKPIKGDYYASLNEGLINGIDTSGYEDWTIQTKSFTLERNDEGYWNCTKLENIYDTTTMELTDALLDTALSEAIKIESIGDTEIKGLISGDTAYLSQTSDPNVCEVIFPVRGYDYYISVTFTRKDENSEWTRSTVNAVNVYDPGRWANLHIALATDELLDEYDSFYEYVNDEDGDRLIIWTDKVIEDFAFVTIKYETTGDKISLIVGDVLYSVDELSPEKPFVVTLLDNGGVIPTYGISFVDENGAERFFSINLSGRGAEEAPLYSLVDESAE